MRLLFVLLSSLILAACTTTSSVVHTSQYIEATPEQNIQAAQQFLQLANNSPSPQKQQYQLQAASKFTAAHRYQQAKDILQQIDSSQLSAPWINEQQILKAQLAIADNNAQQSLALLQQLNATAPMTSSQQLQYHQTLAATYQQLNRPISSVRERVLIDPLLGNAQQKRANQIVIWENLALLDSQQLTQLKSQADSPQFAGWIELVSIVKQYDGDENVLSGQLQQWQQRYPNHSAAQLLPQRLSSNVDDSHNANQIALLVPLTGKLANQGQAIRNGFLTAYYQQKQPKTTIKVYDTNSADIRNLYQQALADGATQVVGPLTKEEINTLKNSGEISIPTVALNTLDQAQSAFSSNPALLYQFGLSPQDEARQVAVKARKDGHQRAIIIVPQGDWGRGIATSFRSAWQELGGKITDELDYNNGDLTQSVAGLLKVNDSSTRANTLNTVLNDEVKFTPRRRQDVDVIFLAAPPQQARQINPLLSFYFASDIPVYSTSLVYAGNNEPNRDKDLNGIAFNDAPLLISNQNKIITTRNDLKKLWPKSYDQYARFYALGLDAYTVASQMERLELFPYFGIPGYSGTLFLTTNRSIYRTLPWARFDQGIARSMNNSNSLS